MTSPPYGLLSKKKYGNADAGDYVEWFQPFAEQFRRVLKSNGSLVIDLGGAWNRGSATRSLYQYKLLIDLVENHGFYLAQEMFWWNPAKLPTPAEWTNLRRIRVKDAVNTIWWLSTSEWPRAHNSRVLVPYSSRMKKLLKDGYKQSVRPSGHDISDNFAHDNGAAIPPNLIAAPNTESNSQYQRYCAEKEITPHPARFPRLIPEYFIRMLTDPGDLVIDPFAGSCVTGEAAEVLHREWICIEKDPDREYLKGARGRFVNGGPVAGTNGTNQTGYEVFSSSSRWNEVPSPPLRSDGGRKRSSKHEQVAASDPTCVCDTRH